MTENLSPWEEWFICKERELRARLQARAMEVSISDYFPLDLAADKQAPKD